VRILRETLFEPVLIESGAVERAEARGLAAESSDKSELSRDEIDDETELRMARKVESGLSLTLHFVERIAAGEKLGNDTVVTKGRGGEIADPQRRVEGVPGDCAAHREMPI
jgi:hypothetical protein